MVGGLMWGLNKCSVPPHAVSLIGIHLSYMRISLGRGMAVVIERVLNDIDKAKEFLVTFLEVLNSIIINSPKKVYK